MDQVQLKNFILLAQTLNYSAVAKQEFISQPALTKQINRLEEELGVRLFHRTRHDVSLTYAGSEFYKYAVEIVDGIERATYHMESIRQGKTGSLEISTIFGLDDEVSRYLERFAAGYPEVSVNITSGTGAQQVLSINRQDADLYFSFAPLLELYPSIESIPLSTDRFAVYINERDGEILRQRGFSYLDELTQLVEYRSEGGPLFTGMILSIRDAMGLGSGRISYYSSNSTILIAVQAGMGFALLPTRMNFGCCPDKVTMIPLDIPEAAIHRAVGWNRNNRNVSVEQFADIVRGMAEEQLS